MSAREKYGEELRLRRRHACLTQEQLGEAIVCSPSLISHFEAGRRLPTSTDAERLDRALATDGWFSRWLKNLEGKFPQHFVQAAELEQQATEIKQFDPILIPGLLQTRAYARTIFAAYRPNHTAAELDQQVVNRVERARVLETSGRPSVWTLIDEAVVRRRVGPPGVMTEQLEHLASLVTAGRVRLHITPFSAGAHALMEGNLNLLAFAESAPVAYVEGVMTGHLMDDPEDVVACSTAYHLAMADALSQRDSLALLRAAAEEHS